MNNYHHTDATRHSEDQSPLAADTDAPQADQQPTPKYRRNGNIARLPKALRDKVNFMLQDGVPYKDIIQSLGDDGKALDKSNLTHWKNGGYQDWLLEQGWLSQLRLKQESASDVAKDFDGTQVNHAALQVGTLHVFEAMKDLSDRKLDEKLGGDSMAFARLLNALARASRETLSLQKYRDTCLKAQAAWKNLRDPNRKLTDQERRNLVLTVDEILGLSFHDGDVDPTPTEEQTSHGHPTATEPTTA